ncbi:MAG: S8 family serine peptidase [Planctomycetaceae bacterium]|nr:S8 family serine peptidase [Planctomycetaceae bacterium]
MWRQVREIVWGPRGKRRGRRLRQSVQRFSGRFASIHGEVLEARRLLSASNADGRDALTAWTGLTASNTSTASVAVTTPAESLYLVQFDDATVTNDAPNLRADRRAEPQWLTEWHLAFVADIEEQLTESIEVDRSFTRALNAVSLRLTEAEASAVAADSRVLSVLADGRSVLQSNSAEDTGARDVWTGAALSQDVGTLGEGILIGIIDSGIDLDNPSFAAVGPVDGYVHTNPFGEGQYVGLGDPNHPDYDPSLTFNSKVVGGFDFTADTTFGDPNFADHGTSVAGIAAGNFVDVNIPGTSTGTQISGVAPHANIIAFDVCDSNDACSNVAIVSAVDQAIISGVDVINMSIGGPSQSPWNGVMAQAMWSAHEAGIFVAVSAGNDGPGPDTITAPADAPWVTAVAAGRVGEETSVTVSGSGSSVPAELLSINAIRGQNVSVESTIGPAIARHTASVVPGDHLGSSAIAAGELAGQIAVIDRGESLFATKVANAEAAGAIAVVIVNNVGGGPIVMAGVEDAGIPSVMISREDGQRLRQWMDANPDARLTLNAQTTIERSVVAGFSSRGENEQSDTLAPHITAPGSDFTVIAPRATLGADEWDYFSGTSAASPHVAGAAALLLAVNPSLTPSEVQSALQLTASDDQLVTGTLETATPFDGGSGFIDVAAAVNAGLVLDESSADFLAANPQSGGDTTTLNVASFVADDVGLSFDWTRQVRSTASTAVTWTASFAADTGLGLSLQQTQFTISAGGTASLQLNAVVDPVAAQNWLFGEVRLSPDNGGPVLEFPVAVRGQAVPEVRLIVSGTGTDVSEAGATDQYELQLASNPAGLVTIEVTAPSDLQISSDGETFSNQLTLSISDNFVRTITVRAVDDAVAESTRYPSITHQITSSTAADYPVSLPAIEMPVHVFDNDRGMLSLAVAGSVTEGGGLVDLTVGRSDNSDLTEPLPVELTSSDQLAFFDAQGQPLTQLEIPAGSLTLQIGVAAVDDQLIETALVERITVSAPQFDGAFVDVDVLDNDVASLKTVETNGGTLVSRIGTTDSFTVQLRAQPRSSVEVIVSTLNSDLVTVDRDRLIFTVEQWMQPQTVTVTGRDDNGTAPDQTTIVLTVDAAVSDDDFDDLAPVAVTVDVVDSAGDLPQIISPRGRTVLDPPTYRWAPVNNAESYELYVERSSRPGVPILNITIPDPFHHSDVMGLGQYRFWVRANLAGGGRTDWVGDRFQITTPPVLESLPYYGTDPQPEFRWTAVEGAVRYQVYVNNVTTGQTGLINESHVVDTRFVPVIPLSFGVHRIWVRAIDTDGVVGDWSTPQDYYLGPSAVTPVRSTFAAQPEFQWTAVNGATSWELFIRVPGGGSIQQTLADNRYQPSTPLADGRHVWWVRPVSAGGHKGPWSEAAETWIGGRTQLLTPLDTTTSAAPPISWEAVDGAAAFNVFLNRTDTPQHIESLQVSDTTWNPGILADGTYRIWVQPVLANGSAGYWSDAHDFTVAATESSLATAPALPATVAFGNSPQFAWLAAGDATYEVFLIHDQQTLHAGGLTGTSWTAPDLGESAGRWWVRAVDANGRPGPWSESAQWNTLGRAVASQPVTQTTGLQFDWSPVQGADRYIIQVDNLTTGETRVIRQDDLTDSSFLYTGSLPGGQYRFWVRAIRNADPSEGFWSVAVDFTVA